MPEPVRMVEQVAAGLWVPTAADRAAASRALADAAARASASGDDLAVALEAAGLP